MKRKYVYCEKIFRLTFEIFDELFDINRLLNDCSLCDHISKVIKNIYRQET